MRGRRDLSRDDVMTAYENAVRFASPGPVPDQRAYDYADWYNATCVYRSRSPEELPDHRRAWSRFLAQRGEGGGSDA